MASDKPNESSIFNSARKIRQPEERLAFIAEACGTDGPLRQRVEKLLAAFDEESQFLEQPAPGLDDTIAPDSSRDHRAASLDAGLALSFDDEKAVFLGNANHSVLRSIGNSVDEVPRVTLRDSETGSSDPILPENPGHDFESRYRLDGEIARGGMGAIIKGRDTDLGRDLAIKVLLDSHRDRPEVVQRFVEEAQIGGQLQHPGIAPIYELGQFADERPFFAMKLVQGETLSKLLAVRNDAAAERGKFIGIFEQICQTMAYAHSRGVIHRDLKPDNIMVGAFGEVQVMDWGLAKVLQASGISDDTRVDRSKQNVSVIQTKRSTGSDTPGSRGTPGTQTQMGSVMGTPAYMPPEQAHGEVDQMDERADVFGLGAILCEILTGKPPYVADDGTRVFRMASRGKLENAFSRLDSSGADANLISLTKHCLELDPKDRPRDSAALAERVTGYLESVESKLRETERANADAQIRAEELRRRQKLAYRAGIAVVASLVIGISASVWQAVRATRAERVEAQLREKSDTNAAKAIAEAKRATAAEALAMKREVESRNALARSAMSLAEAAHREENGPVMQAALNDVPPSLRDSSWRYLLRQSDSSIAHIHADEPAIDGVAPDPVRPGVFALVDRTGMVTVMHVPTGKRLLEFQPKFEEARDSSQYHVAFSRDGTRLAVGRANSGGIVICRASDGTRIRELAVQHMDHLEFGDGDNLLSWGYVGSHTKSILRVWNTVSGKMLWERRAGGNIGARGAFIPGSDKVLLYTEDDPLKLQVVHASDGKLVRKLDCRNSGYEWSMFVHPSGKKVFTCNESRITECMSLIDGSTLFTLPNERKRHWMQCSSDGELLVTAVKLKDGTQSVEAFNANSGEQIRPLLGGRGEIRDLGLHPRSSELIVAGADTRAWDLTGAKPRWTLNTGSAYYDSFSFWGKDDLIFGGVTGPLGFGLKHLRPDGLEDIWRPAKDSLYATDVSRDGRFAVVCQPGVPGNIELFRLAGGSVQSVRVLAHDHDCYSLRFSPSGHRLAYIGSQKYDVSVKIVDTASGDEPAKLDLTDIMSLNDLGWAGDDRVVGIVTANAKRGNPTTQERVVLWDASTGSVLKFVPYPTAMDALVVSPDGSRLAEAGADKKVRIRDAVSLDIVKEFRAHNAPIAGLDWHPFRPVLATASEDRSVKLWDLETEDPLTTLNCLTALPRYLDFSPSGRSLAVQTWTPKTDGRIGIWDFDGEVLSGIDIDDRLARGVSFFREGQWQSAIGAFEGLKTSMSEPWPYLAMAHWQLGQKQAAMDAYCHAVDLNAKFQAFSETEPVIEEARKQLGIGRQELEQLQSVHPTNAGIANELAKLLLSQDSVEANALANGPSLSNILRTSDPWERLAIAYFLAGNQQALEALFQERREALGSIGDLHLAASNWQQAITLFDKLITADTTNSRFLGKRAKAHIALEQWDLARADWRRVVAQHPDRLGEVFNTFRQLERWDEAAEFGLLYINASPGDHLRWLFVTPMVILTDDDAGYAKFCERSTRQFVGTEDLSVSDIITKTALLKPNAIPLDRLPSRPFIDSLDNGTANAFQQPWFWGSRALLAYRRGDAESAVKYVTNSEKLGPVNFAHALNLVVLALAQHDLEQSDQAKNSLDEAFQYLESLKADPLKKTDHDFLIATILYREAKAKINKTTPQTKK